MALSNSKRQLDRKRPDSRHQLAVARLQLYDLITPFLTVVFRNTKEALLVWKVMTRPAATVVQVVHNRHGKLEIINHVGSGRAPVEVVLPVQRVREILQVRQGARDLCLAQITDVGLVRAATKFLRMK